MRVEPYTVGSYLHIVKRGARGADIVRDEADKWRFLRSLYYLNDEHYDQYWPRIPTANNLFERSEAWPERDPLIEIAAFTLMPNHFHLLVREVKEGGVSKFMQKLGQGMTNYTNEKYEERGSLFQGAYRAKNVASDEYLRYVSAYIMAKNTFELYPKGGLKAAAQSFDEVWQWALTYPFSSFGSYAGQYPHSPVLTPGLLGELFTAQTFKSFAKDVVLGGTWINQERELE